jgi:hypothetical protein
MTNHSGLTSVRFYLIFSNFTHKKFSTLLMKNVILFLGLTLMYKPLVYKKDMKS